MFGRDVKVPTISVEDFKNHIDRNEEMIIIDVRMPQELSRGKIAGSINIPLDQIQNSEKFLANKNARLYVYCLSGSRSVVAVDHLIKMGYKNAVNIRNGLLAWRIKYPLV